MNSDTIYALIGTIITGLSVVGSLVWWAYRRGQRAGAQRAEDTARIKALEVQLTETRRQLVALQVKRGRGQ